MENNRIIIQLQVVSVTTKSQDLWHPYKKLFETVEFYLSGRAGRRTYNEFENILKRTKQTFFSLLQHPVSINRSTCLHVNERELEDNL